MTTKPNDVTVWIGVNVGKEDHFADVLNNAGDRLFARPLRNDEADTMTVIERASKHGTPALMIDQPGSVAQLAIAATASRSVPVAYIPGLVMYSRPASRGVAGSEPGSSASGWNTGGALRYRSLAHDHVVGSTIGRRPIDPEGAFDVTGGVGVLGIPRRRLCY